MVTSAGFLGLIAGWVASGRGDSAQRSKEATRKKAETPLITRLNYPTPETVEEAESDSVGWDVYQNDRTRVVTRKPNEVRAVLRTRPAASEELGGMPEALREKLDQAAAESVDELLPLYQQWGCRNGVGAAADALGRVDILKSDKILVSALLGWMLTDRDGPARWYKEANVTDYQRDLIGDALKKARGW